MRAFQYIVEGGLVLLVLLFIYSQIVKPALRGTGLFPFFRDEEQIKAKIFEEQVRQRLAQLDAELEAARADSARVTREIAAQQAANDAEAAALDELDAIHAQATRDAALARRTTSAPTPPRGTTEES